MAQFITCFFHHEGYEVGLFKTLSLVGHWK